MRDVRHHAAKHWVVDAHRMRAYSGDRARGERIDVVAPGSGPEIDAAVNDRCIPRRNNWPPGRPGIAVHPTEVSAAQRELKNGAGATAVRCNRRSISGAVAAATPGAAAMVTVGESAM